jgi:hypothetical protein
VRTDSFPRDLLHFSDHVHLRDAGLDAVARFLTPPSLTALQGSQ